MGPGEAEEKTQIPIMPVKVQYRCVSRLIRNIQGSFQITYQRGTVEM
jgi:hypothetical protein